MNYCVRVCPSAVLSLHASSPHLLEIGLLIINRMICGMLSIVGKCLMNQASPIKINVASVEYGGGSNNGNNGKNETLTVITGV